MSDRKGYFKLLELAKKLLRQGTSLSKESVANISQIITLDKSFLTEKIGPLSARLLKQVETGIKLVLEI